MYSPVYVITQGQKEEAQQKKRRDGNPAAGGPTSNHPTSHWRSRLTLNIVGDHFMFDKEYLPSDVHRYLRV